MSGDERGGYVIKVADFGLATDLGENEYYKVVGTKIPIRWTAPGNPIHAECDSP